MKTAFITGANGLIGSFLTKNLLEKGYTITALRRDQSDLTLLRNCSDKINWVNGDILDITLLSREVKDFDLVIHAAGYISFASGSYDKLLKVNVEGTANVVNACLSNNIRRFCHISSIAAIGRPEKSTVISEDLMWEESSANSRYAQSKYLAELEVWRGIEEGLNGFVVNPSVVLGPGNWESGSTKLFKYVYNNSSFFSEGEMNFIDVRDVCDIVIRLAESEIKGERYILNGGRVPYKTLFEEIARSFNKKAPSIKVNRFLAEIAWRAEAVKSFLTGKDPLITAQTAKMSRQVFSYDNSKVVRATGITFRPLNETVDWVCKELEDKYVNN